MVSPEYKQGKFFRKSGILLGRSIWISFFIATKSNVQRRYCPDVGYARYALLLLYEVNGTRNEKREFLWAGSGIGSSEFPTTVCKGIDRQRGQGAGSRLDELEDR